MPLSHCLVYNASMLEKGLVQIYTGNGKGKTTAAFGLALRAAGQGNKVLICQFLKPPTLELGERLALKSGSLAVKVETLDVPWDMSTSLGDAKAVSRTQAAIAQALERITRIAEERSCDVLILDEIVFCLSKGLAELRDIRVLIERRDPRVEIVLTGRGASEELVVMADLVTEMRDIKHPLEAGLPARRGIEY